MACAPPGPVSEPPADPAFPSPSLSPKNPACVSLTMTLRRDSSDRSVIFRRQTANRQYSSMRGSLGLSTAPLLLGGFGTERHHRALRIIREVTP